MKTLEVKVQRDHLEGLATAGSPITAIAELIWNSLDADAREVRVSFERTPLRAISAIQVIDDGHGLPHEEVTAAFEKLGGSWKHSCQQTPKGRILHGRHGKGRFRAFALGDRVEWLFRYKRDEKILEYRVFGERTNLKQFKIVNPDSADESASGTHVQISNVRDAAQHLETSRTRQALNEEFALYLRQYERVKIVYDGEPLDPSTIEASTADYRLHGIELDDGTTTDASLTVVEWERPTDRALFLCDADGFTLHKISPGIQAPGFEFTAYLRASLIRDLANSGELLLEELHPDLRSLVGEARDCLREHFRQRAAQRAGHLVKKWKEENVYPYEGTPRSIVEEAERQVFEVLALNVSEYLPDFASSSRKNRKMSFSLLRTAIETSPEAVQTILRDVLELPKEKQAEFAELLESTSLDAIINASKVVADRLDFLRGLELLVFDADLKGKTLERQHLHRIVAEHTWLFGEEFNLTASERSLTNVLRRHIDLSEARLLDDSTVVREDGSQGFVDLMFSRVVPQPRADEREHLVVELKRPSVSIGPTELTQVKSYATAIAEDERFRDTQTRWEFWAVSSEMSSQVRNEASQTNRPQGLVLELENARLRVWVKTWGQLIEDCRSRLELFQESLEYEADETSGFEYLRRVHSKYIPSEVATSNSESN